MPMLKIKLKSSAIVFDQRGRESIFFFDRLKIAGQRLAVSYLEQLDTVVS